MSDIRTRILPAVPDAARALIWEEFFRSRGRGVSLAFHSPWIDDPAGLFCVTASEGEAGPVLGTLVVKLRTTDDTHRLGMIGYVCVASDHRGRGISRLMMNDAVLAARERGLASLVLWTQTPQVYRGNGFVPRANDIFRQYGPIKGGPMAGELKTQDWPGTGDAARGIPAFASSARRVAGARASIILLETPGGPAVAEWNGQDGDVADLIAAAVPGDWWLNAFADDGLLTELDDRAATLQDRPPGMMVLPLDGQDPASVPGVRLLDRI